MRFEQAYEGWTEKRLTREEAARLLGVCPRTFRRTINRYEEDGLVGNGIRGRKNVVLSSKAGRLLTPGRASDPGPWVDALPFTPVYDYP